MLRLLISVLNLDLTDLLGFFFQDDASSASNSEQVKKSTLIKQLKEYDAIRLEAAKMQREACKLDYENALLENVSFLCIPCNFSTVTQIYTVIKNIFKTFLKFQSSPKYLKDIRNWLPRTLNTRCLLVSNSFSGFYSNFKCI